MNRTNEIEETEPMNAVNTKSKSTKYAMSRAALAGGMFVLVAGCQEGTSEAPATTPATTSSTSAAPSNTVSVAAAGTRFDPSVNVSQIPDGSWMCDMNGQVHFASQAQGDGTCPVCSMTLVHKGHGGHHGGGMPQGHSGDHQGGMHQGHEEQQGHEGHQGQ